MFCTGYFILAKYSNCERDIAYNEAQVCALRERILALELQQCPIYPPTRELHTECQRIFYSQTKSVEEDDHAAKEALKYKALAGRSVSKHFAGVTLPILTH